MIDNRSRARGAASSDEYMDSLRRDSNKRNEERLKGVGEVGRREMEEVELRGMNAGEKYIRGLVKDHESRAGVGNRELRGGNERLGEGGDIGKNGVSFEEGGRLQDKIGRESGGEEKRDVPERMDFIETANGNIVDLPQGSAKEYYNEGWSESMQKEVMGQISAIESKIADLTNGASSTDKDSTGLKEEKNIIGENKRQEATGIDTRREETEYAKVEQEENTSNVDSLEKQISYLETYLEKMAREEETEKEKNSNAPLTLDTSPEATQSTLQQEEEEEEAPSTPSEHFKETSNEDVNAEADADEREVFEDEFSKFEKQLDFMLENSPDTGMTKEDKKEAFLRLFEETQKQKGIDPEMFARRSSPPKPKSKSSTAPSPSAATTSRVDTKSVVDEINGKEGVNVDFVGNRKEKQSTEENLRDAIAMLCLETNTCIEKTRSALNQLEKKTQQIYKTYAPRDG